MTRYQNTKPASGFIRPMAGFWIRLKECSGFTTLHRVCGTARIWIRATIDKFPTTVSKIIQRGKNMLVPDYIRITVRFHYSNLTTILLGDDDVFPLRLFYVYSWSMFLCHVLIVAPLKGSNDLLYWRCPIAPYRLQIHLHVWIPF